MAKHHDPERLMVSSMDEMAEWMKTHPDGRLTISWATTWKLRLFRILHPFGIHYLVPLKQYDAASDRLVAIGTTCWFC